jgi:hypothetical protein
MIHLAKATSLTNFLPIPQFVKRVPCHTRSHPSRAIYRMAHGGAGGGRDTVLTIGSVSGLSGLYTMSIF